MQNAAGATTMAFDLNGNMTSLRDPDSNTTSWDFDNLNRPTSETNQLGYSRLFSYDANSNLIQETDRDGRVRDFTVDNLNRPTAEEWMNGGNVVNTIATGYNADSQLTSAGDSNSSDAFAFDGQGHLASVDNAGTPGVPHVVLASAYDSADNRASLAATVAGVKDLLNTYSYDTLSRMTSIVQQQQTGGATVQPKEMDLAYNGLGEVTSRVGYGFIGIGPRTDVTTGTFSYNTLGQLTSLKYTSDAGQNTADQFGWTYDPLGRTATFTSSDGTATYGYDNVSQLVSASYTGTNQPPNVSFAFDANGNRDGTGTTVSPNNQVTNDGTFTYTFDHEGNRLTRTRISGAQANDYLTTYTWDYRNRLTDVYFYNNSDVLTQHVHYTYDAFNNMISRSLDATGSGSYSEIDYFVYDLGAPNTAADHAILEFIDPDGSGPEPAALAERFMVGPDLAGLVDQVYAQENVATGATTWLLADNLGSTRDAVDASGTPTAHFNYSAFGKLVAGPTNVTPFLFTGEYTDPATGLQLNANRWYDPATGTWLSPDPTDFGPGDPNLTRYVLNQPTTFTDPTGLQAAAGAPDVYPTGGTPDAVTPADINGAAPPTQVDGNHHLTWQDYSAAMQLWWQTHGMPGAPPPPNKWATWQQWVQTQQNMSLNPWTAPNWAMLNWAMNIGTGLFVIAYDTVAVPLDFFGTAFSMNYQPVSYYGQGWQNAIQQNQGPAAGLNAIASMATWGGWNYAQGAMNWYYTGNPNQWQQASIGLLVTAMSLAGGKNGSGNCFIAGTQVVVSCANDESAGVGFGAPAGRLPNWYMPFIIVGIGLAGYRLRRDDEEEERERQRAAVAELFGEPNDQTAFRFQPRSSSHAEKRPVAVSTGCVSQSSRAGSPAEACARSVPDPLGKTRAPGALPSRPRRRSENPELRGTEPHGEWQSRSSTRCAQARNRRLVVVWLTCCLLLAGWLGLARDARHPANQGGPPAAQKKSEPHRTKNIEDIRVGERVIAHNPNLPESEHGRPTAVDPATWRLVKLRAAGETADGSIDVLNVESLQPLTALERAGARIGSFVELPVDVEDLGLPATIQGEVLAIDPCPTIQDGPGSVVLATASHQSCDLWELTCTGVTGSYESVLVTSLHKFYSATRHSWLPARDLNVGEALLGIDGLAHITIVRPRERRTDVYNLTVEHEHVYRATRLGILVHNSGGSGAQSPPPPPTPGPAPDFVVTSGGTVIPVPKGATGPVPVISHNGNPTGGIAYTGGSGGANGQVSGVRIMPPRPPTSKSPGYPNGYVVYQNAQKPPQAVNPVTGKTCPPDQAHQGL